MRYTRCSYNANLLYVFVTSQHNYLGVLSLFVSAGIHFFFFRQFYCLPMFDNNDDDDDDDYDDDDDDNDYIDNGYIKMVILIIIQMFKISYNYSLNLLHIK